MRHKPVTIDPVQDTDKFVERLKQELGRTSAMLCSTHRATLALTCLYPTVLLAEVSDKEPDAILFWQVGLAAAVLCLVTARFRPWLGAIFFAPAAMWFTSLFLEIHSKDVGPYLRLEQGNGYHLQAYAAFGIAVAGLVIGYLWHRRKPS